MMRVVGINITHTGPADTAMDGGACLLVDGRPVVAVSEERISRQRYDAGFARSLQYCLDAEGLTISDIDVFAVNVRSLNAIRTAVALRKCGFDVPPEKIVVIPSDNLAYASAAYYTSGFAKALVLTLAYNGGAIYMAEDGTLSEISMNSLVTDMGVMYRDFTRLIGYASYQDAGKVMALASYGAEKSGAEPDALNWDIYDPTDDQMELAFMAQQELQDRTAALCNELLAEYKISQLCVAGGVGLNCVNNFNLIKKLPKDTEIMIQPASGATGLCLGAAFYAYYQKNPSAKNTCKMRDVYLGKSYTQSEIDLALEQLKNQGENGFAVMPFTAEKIAELLAEDKVVALFIGKSEFGPRALGHRSLIAAPNSKEAKAKLDIIKQREYYRPYAPSVLAEYAADYFAKVPRELSDFMLITAPVVPEVRDKIPFVCHIDGTSRIQTVAKETEPNYYAIIDAFFKKSGIPMVLNTSFNRKDEPIVETPADAVKTFLDTPIDALLLGNVLIVKNSISI